MTHAMKHKPNRNPSRDPKRAITRHTLARLRWSASAAAFIELYSLDDQLTAIKHEFSSRSRQEKKRKRDFPAINPVFIRAATIGQHARLYADVSMIYYRGRNLSFHSLSSIPRMHGYQLEYKVASAHVSKEWCPMPSGTLS